MTGGYNNKIYICMYMPRPTVRNGLFWNASLVTDAYVRKYVGTCALKTEHAPLYVGKSGHNYIHMLSSQDYLFQKF
jgi:hypothetical protein